MDHHHLMSPILEQGPCEDDEQELDLHFSRVYRYFHRKGLVPTILGECSSLINLLLTCTLTAALSLLDWTKLGRCQSENTCEPSLGAFFTLKLYQLPALHRFGVVCYFLLAAAFFLTRVSESYSTVSSALEMQTFYSQQLSLSDAGLQSGILPWSAVVERVIALHRQGRCNINGKEKMDELEIAARIMRRDNYLIALINQGSDVLDLDIPWYCSLLLPADRVYLTSSLLWCLRYCLLDQLFTPACTLRGWVLKSENDLKRRFTLLGAVFFLLLPFFLVHMCVDFILKNFQRAFADNVFTRDWSSIAAWRFREFNELPHHFEERLRLAKEPAREYLLVHNELRNLNLVIVVACVGNTAGALVAVLLVLSVIREEALLHIHCGAHNLLWWLGLLSGIFVSCRGFGRAAAVPASGAQSGSQTTLQALDVLMNRVSAHTHYYPSRLWQPPKASGAAEHEHEHSQVRTLQAHSPVRDELESLFPPAISTFAAELLSVVFTPIVLCFSLPPCAGRILAFIKDHTKHTQNLGAVVDFALFPLSDPFAGTHAGGPRPSTGQARQGKLESSYLTFASCNRNWRGSAQGRQLVDRLAAYRETRQVSSSLSLPPPPATNMRSMLASLLRAERIDYENDYYWQQLFAQEWQEDPHALEESLVMTKSASV